MGCLCSTSVTFLQVTCSLCGQKVERDVLEVHRVEICAQRIVACKYCEFPLPAVDLFHHQVGSRSDISD